MKPGRSREVSVGVTLMLALVIFAAVILTLGKESRILRSRIEYTTTVSNSVGLKAGSPVVMGGVQIGAVTSVRLPEDPREEGITVFLSVDKRFAQRVRQGSLGSVGFITMLSGEKYINISPGDPDKPSYPDGSFIPTDKALTLLEKGETLAESLTSASSQLNGILQSLDKGEGLLGHLLRSENPYVGQEVLEKAGDTFARSDRLLQEVEEGHGTVGKLFKDDEFAQQTLGNLKSASGRLDRILEALEKREGALGDLTRDDGKSQQILTDLEAASRSLKTVTASLELQRGLIGRLLNDPEYSEAVAADLRKSMASLSSILGKIDRGEGSLGAFVNNPSVYEGVNDIVSGLRKSSMAKGVLRHYGNKGAKDAGTAPKPGGTQPKPGGTAPKPEGTAPKPEGKAPDTPAEPSTPPPA